MSVDPSEYAGMRELLHRSDPILCGFVAIPDPGVAAILGWSGLDVVVLDGEHAPFSLSSARGCVEALASAPAKAMLRVAANDPTIVKQALDLGLDGIIFPMVNDAAEAATAVRACRYAPDGSRGVGFGPATRYGAGYAEYFAEANAKIAVVALLETAAGIENVEEIAAVDGLDGIFVGTADLAADLGIRGEEDHPKVHEALARVAEVGVSAGIKVGTGCAPDGIGDLGRLGMSMFACYFDGVALGASAATAVSEAKESWERQ